MTTPGSSTNHPDIVLIGAGIMSATLAVILKELDPSLTIELYEVLGSEAQESSNAWNNAGTGHAALCELNYTPQRNDGSIDISKALQVNTEFDISRQLWSYLVNTGAIKDPRSDDAYVRSQGRRGDVASGAGAEIGNVTDVDWLARRAAGLVAGHDLDVQAALATVVRVQHPRVTGIGRDLEAHVTVGVLHRCLLGLPLEDGTRAEHF